MRARAARRRGAADVAEGALSWAVLIMQQDGRRALVPVDLGAGHLPLWDITCAPTGETHQVLFELPCWFEPPPPLPTVRTGTAGGGVVRLRPECGGRAGG
eukprot:1415833-Prymnesium_polylepis.1